MDARTDLRDLKATVEALDRGETTSTDLVRASLDRIDESQPHLNAFRVVRRTTALDEAREADRRRANGERLPLLGVPIAIKDDTDIVGETTMFGCAGTFAPKDTDAEVVRRLRAAGAVIVGKTHSPELGQWPLTGGDAFGHTRSAWSRDHTPGGSSGGSAAAVAAGLVPAALGSDGAGSVRIPASWSNLVGIKPQRGRISMWPDAESFNGLTTHGPLARTVADAALLLDVVSGNHPGDRHACAPLTVSDAVGRDPGRLNIALSLKIPFTATPTSLDARVRTRIAALAAVLRDLGHEVTLADPDYGMTFGLTFLPRSMAGIEDWLYRLPDPSLADVRTRANARTGRFLRGYPLRAARAVEPRLHRRVGRIFDRFDVVLAPTTATPPLPVTAIDGIGGWATDKVITGACPYAWPWNVLGWPAINVPAGFTEERLPVGAQLLGPANSEPLLVSLASQLESVLRWHEHTPERWW
ncbi:amidase [Rhodococcus pyridinivorans]|uniref:amidase n=1 Tax=Rhodococcus pyridinivorans TaxID=103816 RepID=UPI000EB3A782|nr:amidase [Rhodococcus pyridinivorans]UPK64988.1 amidase [Rhodococcus pyridinivorans]UTM35714.1 amidase [Rhodococcus pyridinivorans]